MESAAQQVIAKMKVILVDRRVTADQLWSILIKDDKLESVLVVDGKPRKGVLRGVLHRINQGNILGFKSIIDDNGHRKYEKDDNKLVDMMRYVELLVSQFDSVEFDDSKLNGNQRRLKDKTNQDIQALKYDIFELKLAYKRLN